MGLFDKKECAICGGKVKGLFPWQVDGQYICNSCYGITHIQQEILDGMSLEDYKKYRVFREENQKLKEKFGTTKRFDLSLVTNKLVMDEEDGLFCMSVDLSTTIFEASQMEGFTIFEDENPIFEGGTDGLKQYPSFVTDRVMQLTPMCRRICAENAHRDPKAPAPFYDVPEPFKKFIIEIYMKDHPYWQVVKAEMDGPIFSNDRPDVNNYLTSYHVDVKQMTELAHALMGLMENAEKAEKPAPVEEPAPAPIEEPAPAPVEEPASAPTEEPAPAASPAPSVLGDSETILEIKRYKELMDQGIITEEEFTAKKRQLMGI